MRAEDCQEGRGEERAAEPDRLEGQERLDRVIRPVPRPAEERGREDRDEPQDEVHLGPGEPRPRTTLNMDERLALPLGDGRAVVFRHGPYANGVARALDTPPPAAALSGQRTRPAAHSD